MVKKVCYCLIAVLFSHDVLFCMENNIEQNRRSSQERALKVITQEMQQQQVQLSNCAICQYELDTTKAKTITLHPCKHYLHESCCAKLSLKGHKKCPFCRADFWLLKDDFKIENDDALGKIVVDQLEEKGFFKQLEVRINIPNQAIQPSERLDRCSLFLERCTYGNLLLGWCVLFSALPAELLGFLLGGILIFYSPYWWIPFFCTAPVFIAVALFFMIIAGCFFGMNDLYKNCRRR